MGTLSFGLGWTAATAMFADTVSPKTELPHVVPVGQDIVIVTWPTATGTVSVSDVEPRKLLEPAIDAEIEWDPMSSVVVVKLACPPEIEAVPNTTVPSRKVTVPVMTVGTIVAVRMMGFP